MAMAPISYWRDTVTVTRAPTADVRGTQVRDWSRAVPHEVRGCHVQSTEGEASTAWTASGQPVTVRMVVHMPPGADVEAGDRVTVDGTDYAIDGAPIARRSPSGALSHVRVRLIDWRG